MRVLIRRGALQWEESRAAGMPSNLSGVEAGDRNIVYLFNDVACMEKTLPRSLGGGAAGAEAQQGEGRAI